MYKTVQLHGPVKNIVRDLKIKFNFKSESEAIAYLAAIRTIYEDKITLNQHEEALKMVQDILNQQTI